jgi:hypothetical protein
MFKTKKEVKVEKIEISGDDVEHLKSLCEIMDGVAQTIIDNEPELRSKVQTVVTFCRNVKREFE